MCFKKLGLQNSWERKNEMLDVNDTELSMFNGVLPREWPLSVVWCFASNLHAEAKQRGRIAAASRHRTPDRGLTEKVVAMLKHVTSFIFSSRAIGLLV